MNLLPIELTKVLQEPTKVITDDLCYWEMKVLVNDYGSNRERIIKGSSKEKMLKRYIPGYTWME